jgi:hypothetical protein
MARKAARRAQQASGSSERAALRHLDDRFREQRFAPSARRNEYVAVILMSLSAVALGAGVYGFVLGGEASSVVSYAPWVLGVGVVMGAAFFLLGPTAPPAVRVGDLGIGLEEDSGKVSRQLWHELSDVAVAGNALRLVCGGRSITLAFDRHGAAVRRIVAEAQKRLPKRVSLDDDALAKVSALSGERGEDVDAEPPQVTELACRASERPLTIERDVRMCSRCAAFYHRAAVPRRCLECGKKLKGA